ncbi:MAG: relaxase/mobilization nuclease domain-containing protein, partial [Desulfovibrio sp.]|nr:relaxase/mobilization nuclease domain-containing protein [Desulfovibrio sp.]
MYMKVFPHGQGNGDQPTRYLVRSDYPGREEAPPEISRGDPDVTRDLIDSIDRKWKFTAGVLSWHPDDTVTQEQEERVMDDFESVAFAGLEPDQRNILWVRHSHAEHHELHFVIPRLDLASGKDFNACPPGWQKDFDVFRDLHNHREGWVRPDDPARARLHTPDHADLHKARLIRWGKNPVKDDRAEAKEAIHAYLAAKLEQGLVRSREDIVSALREAGLSINRAGKDYITVKAPDNGEKLRLKGGIYGEQWNFAEFTGRTAQSQDGERRSGDREPDPETVRQLEQELGRILAKRAQYNRKRYPQQHVRLGEGDILPLPDYESGLRQDLPASRAGDVRPHFGLGTDGLGNAVSVPGRGPGFAAGDSGAENRERGMGEGFSAHSTRLYRSYPASAEREKLSDSVGRHEGSFHGYAGEPGSIGNREKIDHDRIGKDSQGRSAPPGRGIVFSFDHPR